MNELANKEMISVAIGIDKKSITIGAIIQVIFTLLSRVFGMIRDVMVTHIFGAAAITDAYVVANTIPNVLRQFFGEGAFSVAFVPVYLETKERAGDKDARNFFRDAFGLLLISLSAVTILGMVFSRVLVHLFAYGFADNGEQLEWADHLTRWLFPYVMMISIVALCGAYLACYKKFAAMASAPILLNVAMIACMALFVDYFSWPFMVLVLGTLVGGIFQIALMIFALVRAGLWSWPRFHLNTVAMERFIKMLGPALFGVFVYQLNIIVLRQFASFLGEGQITYYYNADRLAQFATGVFAVSISTAALPELSRGMAKQSFAHVYDTLRFTLTITSFIMTPCAFGLLVFAHPVIAVIFVHGAFADHDAIVTAQALMAFAPSLIAFGLSRPLIQAFYAQSNTTIPVVVGLVTVLCNLILGFVLIRFNVVGLALTLSISSFVQMFLLLAIFKKKNPQFTAKLFHPFCAHVGISLLACAIGLSIASFADFHQGFTIKNAVALTMLAASAGLSYFVFAYVFGLREARKFIEGIRLRLLSKM